MQEKWSLSKHQTLSINEALLMGVGGGGVGGQSMYVPILIFKLGHFAFLGVGHVPVSI